MKEGDKMTIHVAFLRGINVGGRKVIKMDNLKAIFESLQFQNVKTYIQSGNVIFETAEDSVAVLQNKIESKLEEVLGYTVTAIIRTASELDEVIQRNPFAGTVDDGMLYVTFLSKEPSAEEIDRLASHKSDVDDFRLLNREVYLVCRKGYGRSVFSNSFLENKLGVLATTRNWQTVNRIASMIRDETAKRM